MAHERITRTDVENALQRLTHYAGIPQSEGYDLDCYAPDGRKMCVITNAHGYRPFGQSRRTLRELHNCLTFALDVVERVKQFQ